MSREWVEQQFEGPEHVAFGQSLFSMKQPEVPGSLTVFLNGQFMTKGKDYKLDEGQCGPGPKDHKLDEGKYGPVPRIVFSDKWNLHFEDTIVLRYEVETGLP